MKIVALLLNGTCIKDKQLYDYGANYVLIM